MKRPPSYSEGCISDIEYYKINVLSKPLIEDININTPTPEILHNKSTIDYGQIIINKVCSFTFHLLLIAGFEILFFNFFISSYETNSIVSLVDQVTMPLINACSTLNNSTKIIVDNYINSIINETIINNNAMQDYTQRLFINNIIFNRSIYYLISIFVFLIGIITSNFFYFKRQIQFIVIITDNIIMISILGIYEYVFFKNIVFKYQMINPNEIIKNVLQNILYYC